MVNPLIERPLVLAVAAASWNNAGGLDASPAPIRGTATLLSGDLMITALHVMTSFRDDQALPVVIVPQPDGSQVAGLIHLEEEFGDLDLAVISVKGGQHEPHVGLCMPTIEHLPIDGTSVKSVGFAHVSPDHFFSRTLTGSIVSHQRAPETLNQLATGVIFYELSYQCPRGLSGAPVLDIEGRLLGVVVGQQATEAACIHMSEVTVENGRREEHISKHYVTFGVAVDSREFLERTVRGRPLRSILSSQHMRTFDETFGYR